MIMVDVVECACQVGVKNPHPPGFPAQGLEQRSYRVVAAATRPEPIASGLEPGLPLGLQRLPDPGLVAPVQDHWNSERAHFCLITGFRYVHPPDRTGPPRVAGGVHLHRHLGPGLAGQRDLPVNPRGPSARVALRDLPYADQRVRPRPQQQLLQVPRRSQVPVFDRLEKPAPQPPYPLLVSSPVHLIPGITVEERPRARRSVHRSVQLVPWFWHLRCFGSKAHLPTSAPLSGPGTRPVLTASYPPAIREEVPVLRPAVSCCVSAAGIRFLGTLACQTGFRPHCCRPTARTAHTRACAADPGRVYTFRTCETRTGLDALSTPGTTVFAGHRLIRGRRLPPYIGRSLFTPEPQPNPGCGLVEASARVSW